MTTYKIDDPAQMAVDVLPPLELHPGEFLRDVILPEYGLKNVAQLARMIKVQRPHLTNILAGRDGVSRKMAYRFGALLNDHVADLLISYQQAWDLQNERGIREQLKIDIERLPVPAPTD